MELIKIINNNPVPYSVAAFRADNRHTAYGAGISSSHLNSQGVYRVSQAAKPSEVGKVAVLDAMPTLADGVWTQGWTLRTMTADEARAERNTLLQATDVWALSDRTMSAEQTAYRQALRDLTAQAGFPTDITWPTKPE